MSGTGHSRKKLDLTGQRFGLLTVLYPDENVNGRTAWLCRCDCGTELVVRTGYLRGGRATHCGCQYEPEQEPQEDKPGCAIPRKIRTRNLTGQQFGALTVLDRAEKVNGYLAWRCQCACGKEITVQAVHLCRDQVHSCGCGAVSEPERPKKRPPGYQKRDTRKQDLTGKRFGSLTVLRQAENIKDRTAWWCQCDCGREIVVRSEYLRRGKTTHCGCASNNSWGKKLDLIGQRFGKLLVQRQAEKLGDRTAWWCLCDCGREITVPTVKLRNGQTTSCGCDVPARENDGRGFPNSVHMVDGTCVELLRNKKLRCNNTSGVTGVYWSSSGQRWHADLTFKRRRYCLGVFKNFEDAVAARKWGEEFYHDAFVEEFDRNNAENQSESAEEETSTSL